MKSSAVETAPTKGELQSQVLQLLTRMDLLSLQVSKSEKRVVEQITAINTMGLVWMLDLVEPERGGQ